MDHCELAKMLFRALVFISCIHVSFYTDYKSRRVHGILKAPQQSVTPALHGFTVASPSFLLFWLHFYKLQTLGSDQQAQLGDAYANLLNLQKLRWKSHENTIYWETANISCFCLAWKCHKNNISCGVCSSEHTVCETKRSQMCEWKLSWNNPIRAAPQKVWCMSNL